MKRVLEILIMIVATRITPIAIQYATEFRGYKAYGGEYLIPLIGLLVIALLETFCEVIDIAKNN